MFIIRFLRWLIGWICFEAEGGFPERLLNLAAREDIELWGVRRKGVLLKACCSAKEYHRLRSPAHRAGMRMHVAKRHGAPFLMRRYRARAGLAVGLALFLVVLQLFSQRTWVIQVNGNQAVSEEDILSVMEEFGVREGADLTTLDIDALQLEALHRLPALAWCTVNLSGSIAYVEVTERVPTPELSDVNNPSNIKAARDGRVVSVEVYTGQTMVHKGDAVAAGMLLVSGVVESGVGPILRRSQAKILAETTRTIEVSVPLAETQMLPSGCVIVRPTLHLFTYNIPLYTNGAVKGESTLTTSRHMLSVNHIHLPIGVITQTYTLFKPVEIVRTEEEAAKLAGEKLSEKVDTELASAEIQSFSESGSLRDGCYVLTGTYTCIEDICVEEPIVIH